MYIEAKRGPWHQADRAVKRELCELPKVGGVSLLVCTVPLVFSLMFPPEGLWCLPYCQLSKVSSYPDRIDLHILQWNARLASDIKHDTTKGVVLSIEIGRVPNKGCVSIEHQQPPPASLPPYPILKYDSPVPCVDLIV
jgi:hypothetical protein